jgi:RNA polymerase sigma-70 factor (ECF subfamily)
VDGEEGGADLLRAHASNSQEILHGKEDAEQVQIAIGPLSAEFREVILLREFEELSYQEIAVPQNCSAGPDRVILWVAERPRADEKSH